MARSAEKWGIYHDARSDSLYVRFTHEGRRFTLSTGERDSREAEAASKRIYAEVVSGRWVPGRTVAPSAPKEAFDVVAAR